MTDDSVYCADSCGRPADRERPLGVTQDGDLIVELVCRGHETSQPQRLCETRRIGTIVFQVEPGWTARVVAALRAKVASHGDEPQDGSPRV